MFRENSHCKRASKDRFYQEEGRESFDWSGSAPAGTLLDSAKLALAGTMGHGTLDGLGGPGSLYFQQVTNLSNPVANLVGPNIRVQFTCTCILSRINGL